MSLVGQPGLSAAGMPARMFTPFVSALSSTLVDATNEACIMYGEITTSDGASHTLDTSGKIGLRFGSVTTLNAGTTLKIGISDVLNSAGPPARASNAADVISFDCSKTLTGAGIVTANAYTDFTMDAGSKVVANGQMVAISVQMTALGGSDFFNVQSIANATTIGFPGVTGFLASAYTDQARAPNAFITFADGAFGWFANGFTCSIANTSQTWNSGSATKEYGNIVRLAFPQKAYGIILQGSVTNDVDLVLYSVPLSGSPVAEKTISVDQQQVATAGNSIHAHMFPSPFDLTAGVDYMVAAKPTTATNMSMLYATMGIVANQRTHSLGIDSYAANRASGAFAAQNSGLDRFMIGLLVSGGDTGGGAAGYPASRVLTGM